MTISIQGIPEQSTQCTHCGREILRNWIFCPSCGGKTSYETVQILTMSDAENASFLINGLINYHERVTRFRQDASADRYLSALRYSLMLIESLFEQEGGDTV